MPTVATIASGITASLTVPTPSSPCSILIAADPIQTPIHIRGPRSSSAASATPDAGQTSVA